MYHWNDYGNGVYCLDSGYVRPQLASIYLIVENGRVAFIDTGSNDSVPNTEEALKTLGLTPDAVDFIILTHIHLDHAGGAGLMMHKYPNAQLVVHPRGARHMADPSKLIAGVSAVYGAEYVRSVYGDILPIDASRIIEAHDQSNIKLGDRELIFIDTPGHARHHMCIIDAKSEGIFTGDMFGLSYRELDTDGRVFIFPTTTPTQFEPEHMHASIDRLLSYNPKSMYLTHFGRVQQPEILAHDLHRHLNALTDSARYIQTLNLTHETRHLRIKQAISDYLMMQVRMFGCNLDEHQIHAIFETDLELNAQGMAVWLDSLNTSPLETDKPR